MKPTTVRVALMDAEAEVVRLARLLTRIKDTNPRRPTYLRQLEEAKTQRARARARVAELDAEE
jgi:hypothetical protein